MLQISIDLIKENGFTLKKTRSRQYLKEIKTDESYEDDLALFPNTPDQVKSILDSLKQAARDIDLYIKANKTVCVF